MFALPISSHLPLALAHGLLALGLVAAAGPARAAHLADVEVIDRVTGETLPQYRHKGQRYVVGEPGHSYEIAVANRSGERLMAVMSVDGVNVLSGETAATGQSGYVFEGWQRESIRGWRKNLDDIAQFHFTALPDSYAARTGRPGDVGVIGIALFREAREAPPPRIYGPYDRGERYEEEREDSRGRQSGDAEAFEGSSRSKSQRGERSPAPAAPAYGAKRHRAEPSLGTGHGAREYAPVGTTTFARASTRPDQVINIYYDSYPKLVAQGVLPAPRQYSRRRPQAFPGGFVPDPRW